MLRREERGASLVEFALVLPLILMLVLGLVSATGRFAATLRSEPAGRTNSHYRLRGRSLTRVIRIGSESGAALIEMALALVLLVMLLAGIVTSATAFGRDNSIQNAAREASRFGATLPDGGTLAWFGDVRDVARAAAIRDLDPTVPNEEICVAFITSEDVPTHVVDNGGLPDPLVIQNGACPGFDDGRNGYSEARVNVITQRDTPINAILFSMDVTLEAQAGARYER